MATKRNGTLYIIKKGFTAPYGCNMLVYYEFHDSMFNAISREKQIKGGSRKKKLQVIESMNPQWLDLYDQT